MIRRRGERRGLRQRRRARLVRRARAAQTWADVWIHAHLYVYNLDNNRDDDQVAAELRAFAATSPLAIMLCETIGNRLPRLPGQRLTRDASTRSRANLAIYTSRRYRPGRAARWVDLTRTWRRTKGPGRHEPRSVLTAWLDRVPFTVFHAPPRWPLDARAAQPETAEALADALTADGDELEQLRPRIGGGDINERPGQPGPGADDLAKRIGGQWHGSRIDTAATRGQVEVTGWQYVTHVGGVRLRSDHGHALRVDLRIPAVWLRPTRRRALARRLTRPFRRTR